MMKQRMTAQIGALALAALLFAACEPVIPTVARTSGGLTHNGPTFSTDFQVKSVGEAIKRVWATVQIYEDPPGKPGAHVVAEATYPRQGRNSPAMFDWKWSMPFSAVAECHNGSRYGMKYVVRVELASGATQVLSSNMAYPEKSGYAVSMMQIRDCDAGAPNFGARRGFW